MRRLFLSVLTLSLAALCFAKITLPEKTLCYEARYHYGLLKITAGDAYINVRLDGDRFTGTLNGQSIPIGHRIYAISDTLEATMVEGRGPAKENVTYENGWYTKPRSHRPRIDFTNPDHYKNINGGGYLNASSSTMEAVTISTDMLAMFYYFKDIDFSTLKPGQKIDLAINLPDGDVQQLIIDYEGEDTYNDRATHRVTFTYSYHGVMTNYPVTAQIDKESCLPLLLSADIKIGHIELILKRQA